MSDDFIFWFVAIFAAITVGLGKGGLPVIASLAVPSLSLFMSPITAAGLAYGAGRSVKKQYVS